MIQIQRVKHTGICKNILQEVEDLAYAYHEHSPGFRTQFQENKSKYSAGYSCEFLEHKDP